MLAPLPGTGRAIRANAVYPQIHRRIRAQDNRAMNFGFPAEDDPRRVDDTDWLEYPVPRERLAASDISGWCNRHPR
jgi:hypothetical protein